jgi:catechol 2,3-dioxygenase-like lactoylglutathione lyase family enzyme
MSFQLKTVFVALADCKGEQLVLFYRRLLGIEPTVWQPHVYAEFALPGLRLGIFHPHPDQLSEFTSPVSARLGAGGQGSFSLCLEVESLAAAIADLETLGVLSTAIQTASHGREVYAYDPAGNRLILHEAR